MSVREKVVALGYFDGVHLGHGALLRRTAEEAARRGCVPAVFTFDRPPKEVVTGQPCPQINARSECRDLIERLYGITEIVMAPFDREMMTTSWDRFVTEILVGRCRAVHLVAGSDHRFGHRNAGTAELLAQKCAELGVGCDIIPEVEVDGTPVRSTYIRRLIELGQLERAARFLGHPHTMTGTVRHGRGVGTSHLFPTANLTVPPRTILPAHGVYVTRVLLPDGGSVPAVTNVGVRPTLDNGTDVTVESCLLDFQGDLYGRTLRVDYYARLRDERRFDSLESLKRQIGQDAESVRRYFQDRP